MDLMKYILIVGGFIVLNLAYQMFIIYLHNGHKKRYEKENPDASLMVLNDRPFHPFGFINTLTCLSVNGEAKEEVMAGYGKKGHYLLPGKNVLEIQYETQRPGILHKWVRTTYDPQKIEVEVEANKKYSLSYDKNQNKFLFEEIAK